MNQELIEKLMVDLGNEWSENVRSAVHALSSLGQSVLPSLLRVFEEDNDALRQNAARVLKEMLPHEALPVLLELLESEQIATVSKVLLMDVLIHLLEDDCDDLSVLGLLAQLQHAEEESLRFLVAQALGKCTPGSSVAMLRHLSRDPSPLVRDEARRRLSRLPINTQDEIPLWDAASFEAAARLRVRNGLSENHRDAIEVMLERGDDATFELLPLLEDAGEQTFEEMSPILRHLGSEQVIQPIKAIVQTSEIAPGRRLAALRTARDLQPDAQELQHLYCELLQEDDPELRLVALEALLSKGGEGETDDESEATITSSKERTGFLNQLGPILSDDNKDLRLRAAELLAAVVRGTDQTILRFILDALHRFSDDSGRVHLMRALARVMENLPSIQFLLPELLDSVGESRGEALTVGLNLLDKFVAVKSSPLVSDVLLALLERCEDAATCQALLRLLQRVLPRNYTVASDVLCGLESRFLGHPLWEMVLVLCGRICDNLALDTLIRWAQYEPSDDEQIERYRQIASEVLASLDGTMRDVWKGADGRYHHRPAAICECGGKLLWQPHNGREELRCVECNVEYLSAKNGVFVPVDTIDTPLCSCPTCRRKQLLAQMPDGTYICPASNELYTPRFDTKELLRINGLSEGVCMCCQPPQPLERNNERLVCIQTKRSPSEINNNQSLPVIDTLDLPAFNLPMSNDPEEQPTSSSVPSMRVLQLRKSMMPELADTDDDDDTDI